MVAFSKSILFAAFALISSSAVMAQTEIPDWPAVAVSADGIEAGDIWAKRAAAPALPAGEMSNGERLARGMAPRGPDRMYRPRQAAQPAYSPTPNTAMSRTYTKRYCTNTIASKTQLGNSIMADVTTATNRCAARADGSGNNGYDSFAITADGNGGYLCFSDLSGLGAVEDCSAMNFAYYSVSI